MTRFALCSVLFVVAAVCSAQENPDQEAAIAAIRQMKGGVKQDASRPGKPVIEVHLFGGKTAGIGLAPLAKLPEIEWIGLHLSDITEADLDHLQGLKKLKRLGLANIKLSDSGLQKLENMTALEILFLMENPITDAGLDHLGKLTKLKELGLGQTKITDAGLVRLKNYPDLQILRLDSLKITSAGLAHLSGLKKLERLELGGCGEVKDLSPLRGLPLTSLRLAYLRQIEDLRPLAGMPLVTLDLFQCGKLRDLSPLKGAPLTTLSLLGCDQLRDLTPVANANLTELQFTPRNFSPESFQALRACTKLKTVKVGNKPEELLSAADFWKKFDAGEFKP